jgi:hypothetical protein
MIMVTVQMTRETVVNLLSSAIEAGRVHGCGYWGIADQDASVRPPNMDLSDCSEVYKEECWYVHWPLFEGGNLCFIEHDDGRVAGDGTVTNEIARHTLDLPAIQRGLNVMAQKYPRRFAEVMADEIDGPLGEEFLQCCFFGELKYG